METEKRCYGCKQKKLLDDFPKQTAGKLGHSSRCKECRAVESAIRAAAKAGNAPIDELYRALEKDRRRTGKQYSGVKDVWRVMTTQLDYKKQS